MRKVLSLGVAIAVVVALVQIALTSPARAAVAPETTWPAALTTYAPGPNDRWFRTSDDLAIAVTPTGETLANLTTGATRDVVSDAADRSYPYNLVSADGSTAVVRWDPTDTNPYIGETVSVLRGFDHDTLAGGTLTTYDDLNPTHTMWDLAVSADGSRVVIGGQGVSLLDTETGVLTELVPSVGCASVNEPFDMYRVAISGDGNTIATYVGKKCNNNVNQARVYDITDPGSPTLLWSTTRDAPPFPFACNGTNRVAPIALSYDGSQVAVTDNYMEPDPSFRWRGHVDLHDIGANTDRQFFVGQGRMCSIALSDDASRLAVQAGDPRYRGTDKGLDNWGDDIWVTDTTAGATPILLAKQEYSELYDNFNDLGWSLTGFSPDGTAVTYSTRGYNFGYYVQLWTSRDPDSLSLGWPGGAALTADQVGQTFVGLDWPDATGGVSSYRVTGGPAGPLDVPSTQTAATISGLSPATAYHFEVTARNAGASSDPLALDVTTASPAGPGTASLLATVTPDDTVRLQWDPQPSVDGYQVLRAQGVGAFAPVADVAAGVTQWTDDTTDGATTYGYRVAAVTAGVASPHTIDRTVTTAPVAVTSVSAAPTTSLGAAVPGTSVPVRAVGQPNRTATASIAVAGVTSPAPITLTETSSGRYDGTIVIPPGATQLTSVSATLADAVGTGTGHTASRTTALNLPVGGALVAHLLSPGFAGRVVVSSAGGGWSISQPLNLSGDATRTFGVPPATDITVRYVRTADNQPLGGPTGLAVAAGQVLDLPGRHLSEAAGLSLDAGADAHGALINLDQGGFSRQVRLDDAGHAAVQGLTVGPVDITLVDGDHESWRFQPWPPLTKTLQLGGNSATLSLAPRASASISGTVVPSVSGLTYTGAAVAVMQEHGDTSVTRLAKTDADGHFAVTGLLAGLPTTIGVTHHLLRSQDHALFSLATGDNAIDVPADPVDGYFVNAAVAFDDGEGHVDLQPLEWRTAAHYRAYLTSESGRVNAASFADGGSVVVAGLPGDEITLCADGWEAGYDAGCVSATLPASSTAAIDLVVPLSREGRTLVSFALRTAAGSKDPARRVRVLATRGAEAVIADVNVDDGTFTVPSGVWDVTVVDPTTSQVLAALPDRDLSGDTASLGTVPLVLTGPYSGSGNGLFAQQTSVSPGGGLDLTASWSPSAAQGSSSLTLQLPTSVSVGNPSVAATVNGTPVVATLAGDSLLVPVPAVSLGGSGRATVHLDIAPGAEAGNVVVRGSIGGHPLGVAVVSLPAVTLTTPSRVPSHTIAVSGRARSGAEVDVYSGGVLVGHAVASESGAWTTRVTLPAGSRHTVVADAGPGAVASVALVIDRTAPDFSTVTVGQETLRTYTREPGASYPFVVVPQQPMTVSTTMADGSRLTSMDAVLDGVRHPMTRTGDTWSATFTPGTPRGEIYFDYVEAPFPVDRPLQSLAEPRPSTLNDYLATLPPEEARRLGMPTATVEPVDPEGHHAVITAGSATLDLVETDGSGVSTAGLEQIADAVWVLEQPTLQVSGEVVTGSVSLLVSTATGAARHGSGARRIDPSTLKKLDVGLKVVNTTNSARDAKNTRDKYNQLSDLIDRASGCSQNSFNTFKPQVDNLLKEAIAIDAAAIAMEVGSAVLAPATFGTSLALFAITLAFSKLFDLHLDKLMDLVSADMDHDSTCPPAKPKNPLPGLNLPGPPPTSPWAARPGWIYDPSGVVTDGVDPIAGATATLSRSGSEGGSYSVWDAESYEQENDQVTGQDGAYGWNVPEGWYVVTATAPGRVSAQSAELQVLPPRTGVDLVLAPSALADVVSTTATGSIVTVTFDQWMRSDFLTASQLTLENASGDPVAATVVPVGAHTGTDGETYAKSVRLTVPTPTAATVLTVTVHDGVQDVAGRPLAADVVATVTVTPPPPKDCTSQQHAAAAAAAALVQAKASLTKAGETLGKAKKKLKKLKKAGAPAAKIKKAKKKVKSAQAKVASAQASLTRATTASAVAAQALATCQAAPRPSGRAEGV